MSKSPEKKELKAQWKTDTEVPVLSLSDVAKHNSKSDNWIVVHGKAYNVTEYARDHPGGADSLYEVAGTDATSAFEDVGHSEDAREIMHKYLVGILQHSATEDHSHPKSTLHPVRRGPSQEQQGRSEKPRRTAMLTPQVELTIFGLCTVGLTWYLTARHVSMGLPGPLVPHGGFTRGFLLAAVTFTAVGAMGVRYASNMLSSGEGFSSYPAHITQAHLVHSTNRPTGTLIRTEYQKFRLIAKDTLAKDIYRFVFALPKPSSVLGLPIGQHVAIRGYWDDESGHHTITRSYTPVSNNTDLGRLELVIRCYPDGLLTGKYLERVVVGEYVEFRGPTGQMRYRKGLAKQIGMIAGGTGITPMFQIIRAIMEDKTDKTQVRLIYANRSEHDILMRAALDRWTQETGQLHIHYLLDHPPTGWTGGTGFCTKQTIQDHLPTASKDAMVMLCGPPGLVNASKKNLVELGFHAPGAVAKMSDQIFCF